MAVRIPTERVPFHPGEILLEEFLEPMGLSQRELADAIRVPYQRVNERFSDATREVAGAGDLIWVHDYQLQLVPGMVRERLPRARIGFFLHIPFPAEEIFARLPWRREVLQGLLASDVIGFQSRLGARNFARAARQYGGAKGPDALLEFHGRKVRAREFPISIDTARFAEIASQEKTQAKARRLRAQLGHTRKIILGVDRLDYTKGIDVRLRAVEELFASGEVAVNEAVFVQIAVPSRESVEEYAVMRRQIEEIVGRINGTHSEPGLVAVHYLRRSLPQEDLVAYYMAADVMVVTPFRDGMNLVAKEYVACRSEEDGVLVLSEFTGAAHELKQAMLVNPFDIDATTATLREALRMEPTEARRRMRALRRTVRRHDVYKWADDFLGAAAS